MKVIVERTFDQYEALFSIEEGREDYFRYHMMKPFEPMWNTIQVPLKAKQPGGYDVVMAAKMLGYLDLGEAELGRKGLAQLREARAMEIAQRTLDTCIQTMKQWELSIRADELRLGIYLADPVKLEMQQGYCGFGGIPGFIQLMIYPSPYNLPRIPALIAHEFHHNLRFSYYDWDHGNVTVGDYLIIEGLAESFAKELYGEELLGPWVTSMDEEELEYSIQVIQEALPVKGFAEVSSYMFGDKIAIDQGYSPVGLSPFAGYSVGYQAVQSFLRREQVTLKEATLLSTADIVEHCGLFFK
ncbi:hypothetical protein DCC85_02370 [Paenibacillus sp. CAA11]|uniref:DUF2268 domain-containing protein n=1 Tax=Paenibacillus sp. CAA11 TaxID=1532905 RepID=UPI000D3C9353|nr:DUF2268 domain-containing protein [Paenibacillus sp. CAA11]AWB43192.1 hypothetical protein DCC85_02370 [Paenibacillus sp. CAA11]